MPVRVPGAGRGDGDSGPDRIDERLGRRRPAAVVGDLEQVDMRQAVGQQRRVDAFLDVAHQQEAARTDLAEEDHRDVVDAGAAIRRDCRDLPADRPQHVQVDLVDGEPVAGGQAEPDRRAGSRELAQPGGVAGARPAHPRFEDAADVVALEEQRESGHVILVRVGQDQGVDPPIPRRDAAVERDQQPVGIRTTVDEQPATVRALDEDRVALPDVEDRNARGCRPGGRQRRCRRQRRQR